MQQLFGSGRFFSNVALALFTIAAGAASAISPVCGPFTDVDDVAFCPYVLEIFTLGITTGTTPTTYEPAAAVSRLQMAAFLSRTVDSDLKRASRRAALDQFWTTQDSSVALTTVGSNPAYLKSDGLDVWVPNYGGSTVSRVRASDGKLLETWTGATSPLSVLIAMGRVFVASYAGRLYRIDPSQAAGAVTAVATNLGSGSTGIAFDGKRIWTTNRTSNSVSITTPGATIPWTVTTVTAGFTMPFGIVYDSANMWITDSDADKLLKLNSSAGILQTVTVGNAPRNPAFDGTNIWVPNGSSNSVSVVRASSGTVIKTLTGNGLLDPRTAAFDGQRVLITNFDSTDVSLFKAADATPIGYFDLGAGPLPAGACSDGINFWIALNGTNLIARF